MAREKKRVKRSVMDADFAACSPAAPSTPATHVNVNVGRGRGRRGCTTPLIKALTAHSSLTAVTLSE